MLSQFHFFSEWIENVSIFQVLSLKPTKYQYFVLTHLCYSCSLPGWKSIKRYIYQLPWVLLLLIIFFNRIAILFGWIGYATKHINKSVSEWATGMVVSSFIQIRKVKPNIYVHIVLLTFHVCTFIFFPWSCYYNKLFSKGACSMTMPWVFHFISQI